ncbi:MAG: SurA N-terminal domain-containing protein, partial [Chloroflexi bacterium]|nr:SurA N-terminal domain-containing protein [Chloroflexota bacterium]
MRSSIAREEARRRRVSRQQVSRWQRDKRTRLIVFGLIALVLLAILAVPAYGYYREFLAPPSKKVTKVNSKTFTMGYYVKRLRMLTMAMGGQLDFSSVPFQLVDNIENEEIARLGAPRLGITATPEEITSSIREAVQPQTPGDAEVDPKKLASEFDRLYKQYLNTIKLSDKEFRDYIKAQILQSKIREQLGERIPKVAPQVRVQAIVVAAGEDVDKVKTRLAKGDDFVAVSDDVNGDEELKANKAEMGWVPRGVMGQAFDDSVFNL